MTPTALTPAARRAAAKRAAVSQPATSHPRRVRRPAAPTAPRRVSGPVSRAAPPARPAVAAAAAAGAVLSPPARPVRRTAPRRTARPRRSNPLRAAAATLGGFGTVVGRAVPYPRRPSGPLGARLAAGVRTMPEHRLIDRLVRGRAWIPVLGVMLAGIVFMQVETLKLGAAMGRSVQDASTLSARNQQLRASVATLGDDQRIESMAAQMGMIMPSPTAVGFLDATASVSKALSGIVAPSDSRFLNATSGNGTVALNNDLAQTGGSSAGAITIAPAPGTTGSSTSPTLPSASAPATSASGTTTPSTSSTTAPVTGATTPTQSPTTPTQSPPTDQTASTSASTGGAQIAPATSQQSTGP